MGELEQLAAERGDGRGGFDRHFDRQSVLERQTRFVRNMTSITLNSFMKYYMLRCPTSDARPIAPHLELGGLFCSDVIRIHATCPRLAGIFAAFRKR